MHFAFQIMVGCGMLLVFVTLWSALRWWRYRHAEGWMDSRWLLRSLVFSAPLGFVAIEAGWVVTEVGRQPWIIQGVMRTAEAVTPMPGLVVPFVTFTILYIFLAVITAWLLLRQVAASPDDPSTDADREEVRDAA